jgi:bifunctional DNA-binding transcriptional regulator/antitoxin component of YhaV-PrlF toxin-antitoxin module
MLPRAIRQELNWQPGKELEVERRGDTVVLKPRTPLAEKTLRPEDIVGVLQWHGKPFTVREMDEAVSEMFMRDPK